MATLKKNYLVEKRNVLNEIRPHSMNLTELRFFSIYLSKIHKDRPEETRVVRFSLKDFSAIMEFSSRLNMKHIQSITDGLLCKIVNVPNERGGYTGFQLFKECTVSQDDNAEWYVEIDAHDKVLPLMFQFKNKYFSYSLSNILRLKSPNQHRVYEILKQYETIGERIISVEKLKEYLGIEKNEYPRYGDFKADVLTVCQKALKENTDIRFIFEPEGKRGPGGKILKLKFIIEKNYDYADQLTLAELIGDYTDSDEWGEQNLEEDVPEAYREKITFLAEACNHEFSYQEIVVLYNEMQSRLPDDLIREDIQCYDYLSDKYQEMAMRGEKTKISHRFAYLRSMIGKEYEK